MENVHGKEISLQYTTVKLPGMKPRGSKVVGSGGDPLTSDLHTLSITSTTGTPAQPLTGRASLGTPMQSNKDKVIESGIYYVVRTIVLFMSCMSFPESLRWHHQ